LRFHPEIDCPRNATLRLKQRRHAGLYALSFLNSGRASAFDPFPGRAIAIAFLGSAAKGRFSRRSRPPRAWPTMAGLPVACNFWPPARGRVGSPISVDRFPGTATEWRRAFGADRSWLILDPMLPVVDVAPFDES